MALDKIVIKGAREHNLKNVNLEIPRDKMIVFTGLSGSGKSSLAFDTIFAEGQRRYIESLSAYARQFLGRLDKPDVDEIEGLSPAISIDQKSHSSNPRSIVATITEIYDYMRVLFSRIGKPHCVECGDEIKRMTSGEIIDAIIAAVKSNQSARELVIMAPVVVGRKGEYYQLLYDLLSSGFTEARVDGKFRSLRDRIDLARHKRHDIDLVTDKISVSTDFVSKDGRLRLAEAVEMALKYGHEAVKILFSETLSGIYKGSKEVKTNEQELIFSARFACPKDNFSFPEIEPRLFSFNSPYGACEACHGLGTENIWSEKICEQCGGKRLRKEALAVSLNGKSIVDVTALPISKAIEYFESLKSLSDQEREIAEAPLREIKYRLQFMEDVGLEYITLDRKAGTLSGGEAQRIRLASQIGSRLVGTLYILDEPTIGLHQRDNDKLIKTLHDLRDLGNTIIVVEHDEATIHASDYLVDIGPAAGIHGGNIVAEGAMPGLLEDKSKDSLTLRYLRGDEEIPIPQKRREVKKPADFLKIRGAKENNLDNIDIDIPLRRFVTVTGVSGSGKSTLVYDVLYKTLANKFNRANFVPGKHNALLGLEYLNRVVNVDQSPIGRTPRSNPATYAGAWSYIRDLFAATPEARFRGYKTGRFSFNVKGGRCDNCEGHGQIAIEMHFLPTVYVKCEICHGRRFNRETLEVAYRDKNIYEVLEMTIEESVKFFEDIPWLYDRLKIMEEVGLGYLKLGQSATTLSGGEAQRIKLSKELGKRDTHRTLYLLDEPTTGLHFEDIKKLLIVLQKLVDRGNTVLVIEHNLDVIKCSDWLIDLGPEGGEGGGRIVAQGTPEEIARSKDSYTGVYLRKTLNK
ncbi:MAG: Excinuclease ABC, subunit A [Candidatus Nomurabacteria bacterium GW2011_GWA1_46_11]|uniref:UvrABC system protein A n=2 Tax=Parcubacteria group TaxID=1794811 RepID=A0A1G1YUZ5_9BACT|nr:MAG: Excinuclease ABC, subunit A [Parcubacteria group bacterium GW2011_GWA2_46_10]KKU22165.1 MAG: Excinuclease ABC, subunit A [Candidatus Nomurabacteria bacterium GW2011_GWA1_46_11]OGY56192.1 MAG: ABC-ATPase UvrA [Candidatus Colwellbacteria bacterium GWA2_46_10]